MRKYMKLLGAFFRVTFRAATAYRSTYFAGIVGQWLGYGATFATLFILTTRFENLGGWTPSEVLLLYGLAVLSYCIAATFFFNPTTFLSSKIRSGEFDAALIKPLNPFVHEIFTGINPAYVSHFTLSMAIIIYALITSGFHPSLWNITSMIFMVIGAIFVQAAALVASSVMSFFTVNENPVLDFLLFNVKEFTNYPITIYPKAIQILLTFILPFAFINFYPASLLLGKAVPEGFPAVLPYLTPVLGIICFTLSVLLWNWGLKHYKSTGS